jgi:hypothetical protein
MSSPDFTPGIDPPSYRTLDPLSAAASPTDGITAQSSNAMNFFISFLETEDGVGAAELRLLLTD